MIEIFVGEHAALSYIQKLCIINYCHISSYTVGRSTQSPKNYFLIQLSAERNYNQIIMFSVNIVIICN